MIPMSPQAMHIESFFDPTTFTFSHILADLHSKKCALIDSVLDYDPKSGRTSTANANRLIARFNELGLSVLGYLKPMFMPTIFRLRLICKNMWASASLSASLQWENRSAPTYTCTMV
jgi:hypothetical protein